MDALAWILAGLLAALYLAAGTTKLLQPREKLLATGKTDLLDKFVSMRTRRAFKAFLTWNAEEGKVTFEFAPREGGSKFPPRKTFGKAAPAGKTAAAKKTAATKTPAAKKAPAKKTPAKKAAPGGDDK